MLYEMGNTKILSTSYICRYEQKKTVKYALYLKSKGPVSQNLIIYNLVYSYHHARGDGFSLDRNLSPDELEALVRNYSKIEIPKLASDGLAE